MNNMINFYKQTCENLSITDKTRNVHDCKEIIESLILEIDNSNDLSTLELKNDYEEIKNMKGIFSFVKWNGYDTESKFSDPISIKSSTIFNGVKVILFKYDNDNEKLVNEIDNDIYPVKTVHIDGKTFICEFILIDFLTINKNEDWYTLHAKEENNNTIEWTINSSCIHAIYDKSFLTKNKIEIVDKYNINNYDKNNIMLK